MCPRSRRVMIDYSITYIHSRLYCSSSCSLGVVLYHFLHCHIHQECEKFYETKIRQKRKENPPSFEKRSFFSCCCRLRLFAQNQLSRCNFIFSIFSDDVVVSYIPVERQKRASIRYMCVKYSIVREDISFN